MTRRNTLGIARRRMAWLLTGLLCVLVPQVVWSQGDNVAPTPREFVRSLTESERKLPQMVVVQQRLSAGVPVPEKLAEKAQGDNRSRSAPSPTLFQIHGHDISTLVMALHGLGVEPQFVSSSRPYVTASLTETQAVDLAESTAVSRISFVVGPTAQGTTAAFTAHRVSGLASATPPLTGTDVVVGLISLPYKSADLTSLDGAVTRIIPESANLYPVTGAVDEDKGTTDLLFMLQLIYDIAPDAKVVVGSPGANSTAGQMHTLIDTLVAGNGTEGDGDYVPPVNIIVDDLFYPTQNPFEVDEIAEAVIDAAAAGVLYITAAGDHGSAGGATNTSGTLIETLNVIPTPTSGGIFDEVFSESVHEFGNGKAYLSVSTTLSDLCFFWNERPASGFDGDDFEVLLFNTDGDEVLRFFRPSPGGCLSQDGWSGDISSGFKVVIEDYDAPTYRLLISGTRKSATLGSVASVFDVTSAGNIRGHAYHPDALTVGAVPLCDTGSSILPYNDASCDDLDLAGEPYTADAENPLTARFYWESDGGSGYQAVAGGGLAAAKPNVAAASESIIFKPAGGSLSYAGTSASAAVVAGLAATYWQYAKAEYTSLDNLGLLPIVRYALEQATLDVDEAGFDTVTGKGVIDGPKSLDDNLFAYPVVTASAAAKAAGGVLSFTAGLPASAGATYVATCQTGGAPLPAWDGKTVVPDTPYPFEANPGAIVNCAVTGTVGDLTTTDVATVTATAVDDTVVTVTAEAGGVSVRWTVDPDLANRSMAMVSVSCTQGGGSIYTNADASGSSYFVKTEDTTAAVTCTVDTTFSVNGGASTSVNSVTQSATPEESLAQGLPVWLLYIATQPE